MLIITSIEFAVPTRAVLVTIVIVENVP
jgi:hypothetical protein